jgi:glutathione-independent formaldehyde dehydrogenase
MKAVVYEGPREVSVREVPDAKIERPTDDLARITSASSACFTGKIGVVGVFAPQDPGANDELAKQGRLAYDYGMFWFMGHGAGA